MKQMTSPSSMHAKLACIRAHSNLVHHDNPEGWDVKEVGRGFGPEDTCTPVADSCQCMVTTTIL